MTSSNSPAPAASSLVAYARDLWDRREFAAFLAMGNLKARNASTALGLFWWVFNPLLLAAIYWLVFGILLSIGRDVAHLVSGLFVFEFTKSVMTGSANSILNNQKLLVNLKFPRMVLPFSALIEAAVGFGASIVAYFMISIPIGAHIDLSMLWLLVPAFVLQSAFNLGLGALMARWIIPFRDLNNLLPYLLRLWLYLSPIIYAIERVRDRAPEFVDLYRLGNPMVPFLDLYRRVLAVEIDPETGRQVAETVPLIQTFGLAAGWAVFFLVVGSIAFIRMEGRMVKYL